MPLRDLSWLLNPGQTSPEDQNRGISGPTKWTDVLQTFFLKKKEKKRKKNQNNGLRCSIDLVLSARHESRKDLQIYGIRSMSPKSLNIYKQCSLKVI